RIEDVLLHEVAVTLAANLFNQVSQQRVSGIAVVPLRSRLEFERFVAKTRDQLLRSRRYSFGGTVVGKAGETGYSRSVSQQMVDRDLVPRGGCVRHAFLYRIVDLQFAALLEQKDARRRELLGNRAQSKLGRR